MVSAKSTQAKSKTPIKDFLVQHASVDPVSFHMPGHKGSRLYDEFGYRDFLNNIMNCDITEITGADNLFQTEGIIRETMEHYRELYEVTNSYLLINGTSGGIIASILASVRKGHKLVMARNCHKAVFNALTLGDIDPVYAYPQMNEDFGISGPIASDEIARLLDENEDADAVILPSPNYYGICSDIVAIAEEVHKRGKVLIVDQAHGAHLKFFSKYKTHADGMIPADGAMADAGLPDADMADAGLPDADMADAGLPLSAEESGADLVINSTHKTLASLTQSAILNRNSERVSRFLLEDKLQCIESTSPSYILMASLDINAAILKDHGSELIKKWEDNLKYFYKEAAAIKGLKVMQPQDKLDWTKINISFGDLGITGARLEEMLIQDYDIYIELFTGNLVMCMTGIGNSREDISRLLSALKEISARGMEAEAHNTNAAGPGNAAGKTGAVTENDSACSGKAEILAPPKTDRRVFRIPTERKLVPLDETVGCICAGSVIPYPPGIPFICPGEMINSEAIEYVAALRKAGEKVIGVSEDGEIMVGI